MELVESISMTKVKFLVDTHVNSDLIQYEMRQPTKPTTKEDKRLFSSTYMNEDFEKVNKPPICAKPKPLKSCSNTAIINLESEGCSLVSTICNTFLSEASCTP